tara:strand:+ start:2421 stop:3560 length:1140 start_codon:yes stop_codon:yes gene_type:complete
MAFSFTDLLKKQFPLAGVEAYTGSPKRMPKELDELSPFLSTSALGMGGALNVLDGVSMADYFNNDNYEMQPTEASPKRGEDVLRPYRMSPGDKKTIKVNNNGKIVETTERTTGDLFSEQPNMSSPPSTSAQTFPLGEGAVGDPTAIFRNEFEGGRMPTNTVYPRPTTRSMYNRPNEYQRMASMNPGMGGPLSSIASNNPYAGTPYIPIDPMSGRPFNNVDSMGGQGYIPNNVDLLGGQGSVGNLNNTVYPRPTTRSMYNRPVNSPDFMGGQGSVGDTGYRGTYGVPMYGQPRPTSAQTSPIINSLLEPEFGDTAQSELNRMPTLVAQGEDGVFPNLGSNIYGPDEGLLDEDPDDERRRLLGELLREYYQKNSRIYTLSI